MQRIRFLDLARGFTVLFIPAIHTGMLYSDLSVHESWLGKFLIFIAEGPGGQLLMLLMGFSFTLKKRHAHADVITKSIVLIAMGYLLNILKFVAPYSLGLLPKAVLDELAATENTVMRLIGIGDILQFSGIALVVLHGVYRLKHDSVIAIAIAATIVFIGPLTWDSHTDNPAVDYLLQLATGQPPQEFFPLFPWLAYPLIGLAIGTLYQKNSRKAMRACAVGGLALTITGLLLDNNFPVEYIAGFYRTPPIVTLWHLGIVLFTLFVWHKVEQYVGENPFIRLLRYSSQNITSLYVIQWVMICWLLPVAGFRELNLTVSSLIMLTMTANTYLINFLFKILKHE